VYDNIAQGKTAGLPPGMSPSPVPGWKPGQTSTNHQSANSFIEWTLDSLKHYHDWQITVTRKYYNGMITMLYPSFGVRPGQLAGAVAVDLAGTTSVEINGELQRGMEFSRMIGNITDTKIIVYSTWADFDQGYDSTTNMAGWSPAKWVSYLGQQNPLKLASGGENTGENTAAGMNTTFTHIKNNNMVILMWAFESELYGNSSYAKLSDYKAQIASVNTNCVPYT